MGGGGLVMHGRMLTREGREGEGGWGGIGEEVRYDDRVCLPQFARTRQPEGLELSHICGQPHL